jgi:hypothetical protein
MSSVLNPFLRTIRPLGWLYVHLIALPWRQRAGPVHGSGLRRAVRGAVQPGLAALVVTGLAEVGSVDTLPPAVAVLRILFQRWWLIGTGSRTVFGTARIHSLILFEATTKVLERIK